MKSVGKKRADAKPLTKKNQSEGGGKGVGKRILLFAVILMLLLLAVILTFAGAAYAYQEQYGDRALFGTKIFGQEVGGLTKREVQKRAAEIMDKMTFTFSVDGEEIVAVPKDVGIEYQPEPTASNAYRLGRDGSYFENLKNSGISLLYRINEDAGEWVGSVADFPIHENIEISYKLDDLALDSYTKNISAKFDSKSQDAGLVIKGEQIQVIPAVYGRAVAAESIKEQIRGALKTEDSSTIKISMTEVRPDVTESEVSGSIAAAQKLITLPVTYSYGGKKYVPNKEAIGAWVTFRKEGQVLAPSIDPARVAKYLDKIAAGINIAAVNKKVKVINQGQSEVTQEGKNGLAVDVRAVASKTANSLNAGQAVNLALPTYVVKFKTEVNNVLVANWDKYIEVDLSSQQMCAYLSGGEKVNCWAITSGRSGWNTPVGTFLIRRKSGAGGVAGGPGGGGVCMPNPPSTNPLCGINYVSTFTAQGHAIHEAWWRRKPGDYNYFGNANWRYNGSHGCINSPYDVAKFIYNWAPIGTPVVIHY